MKAIDADRMSTARSAWGFSSEPDAEAWMDEALCAQIDLELWFPEKGGSTKEAKKICFGCPVRAQCLTYALNNHERYGIWGGYSERERRRLTHGAA